MSAQSIALFPWQQVSWQKLQQNKAALPHAILFHGASGIGKETFAMAFAQSLLCEHPHADGQACGECPSCGWFMHRNHPDYRCIRPEALEDAVSDDSGDAEEKSSAKKAPSQDIKIEQIRSLSSFMNVSTHRSGMRVVVLYPVEALTTEASNAILKTLEEPPENTVFLLVTDRIDRLLPTVLSRCRLFSLPMPTEAESMEWLSRQGIDQPAVFLHEQGGAPIAALEAARSDDREMVNTFLQQLQHPDAIVSSLAIADKLQKIPMPLLVSWLQRWLFDLFSYQLSGSIRYYQQYQTAIAALVKKIDPVTLSEALKKANARQQVATHPLSAKLTVEDMLLEYAGLFKRA